MARPLLKRARTVLWLPAHAAPMGSDQLPGPHLQAPVLCWQEGHSGFESMALGQIRNITEAAVVYDPRDVLLIQAAVPPVSAARLEQMLPNLIEDDLLQDPNACRIALGPIQDDGRRGLAVIDRAWHEAVIAALATQGVRVIAAWPAPLVLPWRDHTWSIALVGEALSLRTGSTSGMGWAVPDGSLKEAAQSLLTVAQAVLPPSEKIDSVAIYAAEPAAQRTLESVANGMGFSAQVNFLSVPAQAPIDLMTAAAGRTQTARAANRPDWSTWRWPLRLAVSCAVVAMICLNLQWAKLNSESVAIAQAIEQRARSVLPPSMPIVDPVLQVQRSLDQQRVRAGVPVESDVVVLLTGLAGALGPRAADALSTVEYRDGRLRVRFQPGWAEGAAAREALRDSAGANRLQLRFDDSEPVATVTVGRQ